MKTLLIFIMSTMSSMLVAQTNIIAAKSCSIKTTPGESVPDNFGLPGDWDAIDTVKYIEEGCIVEVGRYGRIDTLRHADYTQEPHPSFFNQYESTTVFIGFNDKKRASRHVESHFDGLHRNSLTTFGIIFLILFGCSLLYNLRNYN